MGYINVTKKGLSPDVGGIHDVLNFNDILSEKVYSDAVYFTPYTIYNPYGYNYLTIDDNNIASGFNGYQYPQILDTFSISSSDTCEMQYHIKTGNSVSGYQRIQGTPDDMSCGFGIVLKNGSIQLWLGYGMYWNINDGDGNMPSGTYFNPNTEYWIRCGYDGSKYYIRLSSNGETYTEIWSLISSDIFVSYQPYGIGGGSGNYPFEGSIYLDDCYIKKNGTIWWSGEKTLVTPEIDYYEYNPLEGGE